MCCSTFPLFGLVLLISLFNSQVNGNGNDDGYGYSHLHRENIPNPNRIKEVLSDYLASALLATSALEQHDEELVPSSGMILEASSSSHNKAEFGLKRRNKRSVSEQTISNSIVGGTDALERKYGYTVLLTFDSNSNYICGGSIITETLILTAAHCVEGEEPSSITVTAGVLDRTRPSPRRQIRAVKKIHIHPNYSREGHDYDIAILILDWRLNFTRNWRYVNPIRLPQDDDAIYYSGSTTVLGWGDTMHQGISSAKLKVVSVPIVSTSWCRSQLQTVNLSISERMFCAGGEEQDSCQVIANLPYLFASMSGFKNDSGGPAACNGGYLCGVVSFGHECATPGYPSVYTKVSKFLDWIFKTWIAGL